MSQFFIDCYSRCIIQFIIGEYIIKLNYQLWYGKLIYIYYVTVWCERYWEHLIVSQPWRNVLNTRQSTKHLTVPLTLQSSTQRTYISQGRLFTSKYSSAVSFNPIIFIIDLYIAGTNFIKNLIVSDVLWIKFIKSIFQISIKSSVAF